MLVALAALGVLGLVVCVGWIRHWLRHRTYYLPLERMSDGWRREHAADPLPDHLR